MMFVGILQFLYLFIIVGVAGLSIYTMLLLIKALRIYIKNNS
ncbi:hypothetical protein [Clostridium manihotivorum]|nr:hypothetical protein [Clostridium manihotivorum]